MSWNAFGLLKSDVFAKGRHIYCKARSSFFVRLRYKTLTVFLKSEFTQNIISMAFDAGDHIIYAALNYIIRHIGACVLGVDHRLPRSDELYD